MCDEEIIRIASFDIGKINFAFYVEEIRLSSMKSIKNIPKSERYFANGTPTPEFRRILDEIYKHGEKIVVRNLDLTVGTDKTKYFDTDICYNLFEILDDYKEIWDTLDLVIVEKQMSFKKKINTMALKIAQSVVSYLMINYSRSLKIFEFPAYYKTTVLGAKQEEKKLKSGKITFKTQGDKERKKWAVVECFDLLALREDYDTLTEITLFKKKDDVADTIIQLQAFKYLYFIDNLKSF